MKKILSLVLAVMILLSTVITSVMVSANNNADVTDYNVLIKESTTPDNLVGASSNVSISMSGSTISTASYNGYNLKTNNWKMWRPTFFFLTESGGVKSKFMTKQNAKYIVEMEYSVVSERTDNHSLQVGLFGNIGANGQTESAIWLNTDNNGEKLYNIHPAADNGKTVRYAVAFTATSAHNVGLIFYGKGSVGLKYIKISELAAEKANEYAAVTYVDGNSTSADLVKKNSAPKTLEKADSEFAGWYTTSDFSGSAVTNITSDTTLYAKWASKLFYDIVKEESSTPDNLVGASSNVSISMSGSTISTASYNGYNLEANNWKMWRPAFFFLTESGGVKSKFTTKKDAKYIVEMEYSVVSNRTDNHSLQVGLFGNIGANGQTENAIWLDTDADGNEHYKIHPAADNGKTVRYTVAFTATSAHNLGLIFYGQGSITLNSIKIFELPAADAADNVVVKYIDGDIETAEFVKKNTPLKTPEKEDFTFDGWYLDKDFSGEKITVVNNDCTLYAKWILAEGLSVINFHDGNNTTTKKYKVNDKIDVTPVKEGYNFLGWYEYPNFVGRPVVTAVGGYLDLYAKWEERNPDVVINADLSKNTDLITTSKTADSKVKFEGGKLIFDIYNYERQLASTDTSNADSWFPSYYLFDENGNRIDFEFGSTYELEVKYKIVDVEAGDNIGLQIGFGADGQPNQTRTKIKGYAMHKAEDKGKEFSLVTSYTAEKFSQGKNHLPKLLFSGQGVLEVISVKVKKLLPNIKDTVIGVQNYEEYKVGTEVGVLGNKKGIEVSNQANHTSGLFKNKSLKLNLNTNYLRLSGNTIISLEQEGELKPYAAEKGAAYRITFYMYAEEAMNNITWSVNSVDSILKNDYLSNFHVEIQDKVSLKKGEWKEITAYIPVLKGCTSSRNLFAIAVCSNGYDGKYVYIDDVKVEQLLDSEVLLYNTVGGEELEPQRAYAGQPFLSFKEPIKKGYLFDGWYYDAEYKKEANLSDKFPEGKTAITLFAKWIEAPLTSADFTAGSFDTANYNVAEPYDNIVADMDSPVECENTKSMTEKVAWVKDAGIYGNGSAETDGALVFCNDYYSSYNDAFGYNVVRLANEDGTPFTVVKGERYTMEFDYIFASHKGLSYIIPIISEHSAFADMGYESYQTLGRVSVMETDTDYLSYKQSFVAERTGYVYLALTGRDDNANVDTHCYEKVYVDNLKINRNSDVTKLVIKYGDAVWYTLYGIKGEKLLLANAVKEGADTFDGFYTDAEFKTKFNGFFPEEDTTIYVKLKKDKYDTPSDFSKTIVLDFEETELLEDFYRQQKYMTSWAREVNKEWSLVSNDAQNALNGENYIKLNGFSHYWNQAKFALYDPNHPENVMLLDKGGKYRVTVMVRCEDMYEAPVNMTVSLENPSQRYLLAENGNVKLEYVPEGDREGYFMFVGDIEVSAEMSYYPSLAIRRNANDLQTIFIDTVSVEKLRDCTVKFEENGGSEIEDAVLQIHDLLFDPGIPYKDGFVFAGWFVDSAFAQKWDFDKDTVENDITLYAKWSLEVTEDKEETEESEAEQNPADDKKEETNTTNKIPESDLENEEEEDTETDDFENTFIPETDESQEDVLEEGVEGNGTPPNLLDADAVTIDNTNDANNGNGAMPIWVIILICAGSALVLCAAGFVIAVLIKKKNKKQN